MAIRVVILAGVVAAISCLLPASAAGMQPSEEIDGLIIEQSQTRVGHDFYQQFMAQWDPPPFIQLYNVFIIERASPQWGSWIWIKVNETVVFQGTLKPRYEDIREAAKQGVERVMGYLFQIQYLRNRGELEE